MSRDRVLRKVEELGRRSGRMPTDQPLLAGTVARLGSFTSESGRKIVPDRPPRIYLGLTHERLFIVNDRGLGAAALLVLLTRGDMAWNATTLQWLTPQDSGACLIAHRVEGCPTFSQRSRGSGTEYGERFHVRVRLR